MTNPYRALCAELVEALHEHTCLYEGHESELVARARALLAQPVAEGLTDAAAWDLADDLGIIRGDSGDLHVSFADLGPFARAALALCTNPTPHD
jgi:hypothetical protein